MAEHSVTVENTLQTLLSDKKYSTIRDILVTMNPADIAAVFSGSHSVMSSSLLPHGLQHVRVPCLSPSPSPRVCSNSCPLIQ